MLHRILALIRKELLASARDRQTRLVVLIAPPFLLLVYAFAITQEVQNVSIAIVSQDVGTQAGQLVRRFEGAKSFSRVLFFDRIGEAGKALQTRRVSMVVHIPADFSRKLLSGDTPEVQILLDGRRSNAAQILFAYASRIITAYAPAPAVERQRSSSIGIIPRLWFNPNAEALWFAIPALFAVMVAIVAFMVSALSIARERELGTFDQLLVSPLRPVEILAGKTIPALLIATASATAMLFLSRLVLDVPFRGSYAALYIAMTIYLAANIGIGVFISSLSSTQQQAVIGLFIYMTPAVLLSGYATPIENMPQWLQWLTQTNPITHFIILCKGFFLKDLPADVIFAHTWPLALIAIATLGAGAMLFRSKVN